MADWLDLYREMGDYLAPSMAKDHPNLPVVKEEGCYYWGADGKKYLDFTSGIAVTNTGHRHPKVVQAIKDAADSLVHTIWCHYVRIHFKIIGRAWRSITG